MNLSIQISLPAFILRSIHTSQIFKHNLLSQPYITSCESVCFKQKCHKRYPPWHWHFLFLVFFFFNACQTTQIHFCQPRFTKHSKGYWPTNEILLITCAEGVREEKDMACGSLPSLYPRLVTDEGELFQPPHSLEREFPLPTLQGRKPRLSKDLPPRSLSAVGPLSGPPCPTG